MTQPINPQLKNVLLSKFFRPAVTTWNRLEGRPRQEDFDRSLRAEIRDPLWMVCRQWQFGEFKGEDAGSAIKAKVQVNTARLNRYAGQTRQAVGYEDSLPLEARVERESIPFDLMTRAQMGHYWLKLLAEAGDFEGIYLDQYGFKDPEANSEEEAQLRSDRKSWQTLEALKGRVVDGEKLYKAIRSEENDHEQWLASKIPNLVDKQKILAAAEVFETWFGRVYSQPDETDDSAWSDSYLEYQFACAAPADKTGNEQTVLVAEQYHHGHLDWYSVDVDDSRDARLIDKPGENIPDEGLVEEKPISFIPNPIEFAGMPNVRWWEFEDRKTNFGNINPNTSDLATLILAEFGLVYGNDWSLVPYTLEVGTLCEVQGVVVTDVFGVRTLIRPAADTADSDRMRWGMYYLHSTEGNRIDTRLFLPPTVGKIQESSPLERVILTRDEMANMVWGIEDVIPSCINGGANGYEAATDLERYLLAQAPPSTESPEIVTDTAIQYKLGTRVPENWIPFIPVHNPGSNREIRLQRAAMPRLIPGALDKPVEPRGVILRSGLNEDPPQPYFLHDEEVLKIGTQVTRTYQRVRWWNGQVYTWLGRRKQTGRGQGTSGLEFDRIVPVSEE
jgi:hypothetical protein